MFSLKIGFSLSFLKAAGNLVNSEKFLGSGIKCDTSEPGSTNVSNELFKPFTTDLNTLCKPFSVLFDESSAPFH